jgi:hypothetical protein
MTTTKALECWYFADGDQALIRVKTSAPMGSPEFYDAEAERFTARGAWGPSTVRLELSLRSDQQRRLHAGRRGRGHAGHGRDAPPDPALKHRCG